MTDFYFLVMYLDIWYIPCILWLILDFKSQSNGLNSQSKYINSQSNGLIVSQSTILKKVLLWIFMNCFFGLFLWCVMVSLVYSNKNLFPSLFPSSFNEFSRLLYDMVEYDIMLFVIFRYSMKVVIKKTLKKIKLK